MVVQIHGHPASTCTRAVMVALREINVPYEVIPVNFAGGEHKSAEYLENKQPFGQIPVLIEEDGFKLFESRAIARYLISKHAPSSPLIPNKEDLKKNALFEQAMSIENNDFAPFAGGIAIEKVFKPLKGIKGSDERAAELSTTLEEKLKGYERILGKQKYLAGDELTLADLLHLPYGDMITEQVGFQGLKATPNVARWWQDIWSRESWKAVQAEMKASLASQG